MNVRKSDPATAAQTERRSLRNRVKQFYAAYDRGDWATCFEFIDPKLRAGNRVELGMYAKLMGRFRELYGPVRFWYTRISLHLAGAPQQGDDRPFAYVSIVWRDERARYHLFQDRWVRAGQRWHTRVVGLVPNEPPSAGDPER